MMGRPLGPAAGGDGSVWHDPHAFGTPQLNGRLFRHGKVNRVPPICARMPPPRSRSQDRAAPQDHGRDGAGSPTRPTGKALTLRPDRFFPRHGGPFWPPDEATPAPFAIKPRELSGHGRHSPLPSTPRRSADTRLIAPSCPLALIYRNAGARLMFRSANGGFLQIFTRAVSRRTAGGPALGCHDCEREEGARPRRPDVEPRQSGLSGFFIAAFAKYHLGFALAAADRINSPRPTCFPAGGRGGPTTAWP
jgi:hypothetical protein